MGDVDISGIWYVVLAAKGCTYAYMIQYYVVRLIPSYHIPPNSQGMKRVRKRYRGRAYLERLDPFCPARLIFSHRAFFFFASALAPPPHFRFFAVRAASLPAPSLSPYQRSRLPKSHHTSSTPAFPLLPFTTYPQLRKHTLCKS